MSNIYPNADARSQWFANRYQGDIMELAAPVLVLHTTEGVGWWDYQGGSEAPTFTLWHGHGVRQHFPANMSARALKNMPGGVQTNTQGAIQIELVGSSDPVLAREYGVIHWPEATDEQMSELVDLVVWLHQTYGLKVQSSVRWSPVRLANGHTNPDDSQRLSYSQWLAYEGILGHEHVPENDHRDPGDFPIDRLIALVNAKLHPGSANVHANTPIAPSHAPDLLPLSLNQVLLHWKDGTSWSGISLIKEWLKAEGCADYAAWQRKAGYSGLDDNGQRMDDGVPGSASLSKLAARHGYRLV